MGNLDLSVGLAQLVLLEAILICTRIWNGISWVSILLIYFPESQTRAKGEKAKEILKKIDYVGGALSIIGLTLMYVHHSKHKHS